MGNARARGTYEQRKAEAIAAGRVKAAKEMPMPPRIDGRTMLALILAMSKRTSKGAA